MKSLLTYTLLVICSVSFSQNANSLWKVSSRNSHSQSINKTDLPLKQLFDLDLNSLKSKLASSTKRNASNSKSKTIISLPNSEGKLENFYVYENIIMAPELAAKFPEIKSYVAIGIDSPGARAYFSSSPLGFKSMTLYPTQSAVFIEPVTSDLNTYTIYKKSDKEASLDKFECSVIDYALDNIQKTTNTKISYKGADDGKLRTFRLALSCTAEYAAYFGGTKALALAGMNNTLTRINGIFEKDFGLNLILIANNDNVIYTNATTDPYSDYTSKSNWRAELKSNLTNTIGLANYDIGHLLGAAPYGGGGDAGCIGCVCSDFNKGSGYTCANPTLYSGDTFDIDYVAHEMGHQLGANHTYTYVNDNAVSQMEPGSGSTIMGYAGSTNQNVQAHSDAYFHAISIQQVTDNIKTKTCAVIVSTGNAVPVVNAGLDYTIPKGTPFLLTGSATDANSNDVLTYNWEEMDLGNATTSIPNVLATTGPLFRSYSSSTSPTRYLPNLNTILAGSTTTSGSAIPVEILPGVARSLNFRLTVRDNRAGGSANNTDDMVITVDGNSGPFTINSQNSSISFAAGSSQTINWSVAGTNANGVNCASVDILLSTNGGNTFPITLLSGTTNNGSANVVIPNTPGTANRIMVKGTNQIFFDINNANFTITGSGTPDTTAPTTSTLSASGITTTSTDLIWTAATDNVGVTGYNVYQNGVLKTTTTTTSLAVSGLTASTGYNFYVKAKDAAGNLSAASNTVNITTLTPPDITAPTVSNLSASGITTSSTDLIWTAATDNVGVTGYNIYQNGVLKTTTTTPSFAVNGLTASTTYTFYVKASDGAGNLSAISNTVSITTLTPPDATAPSTSTLSASGITTSSTDLTWTAATDNVNVTGYNVYQNGVLKTTTTTTSLAVSDLTASTAYNFYVKAKDAAGNLSAASNTVNITTLTPPDATAPTVSTLSASGITTSSTDLTWTAATDNVGVTGYNVYENGVLKTTTTTTSLAVSGLPASTAYNFYVKAIDAAGNLSAASNTVNVTTLAAPDITAPSASTLSASGITTTSADLTWTAATDNVGVTGYNVYENGVLKTTTTTTSFAVSGLTASTAYNFYVKASDGAGNLSAVSNTVSITTLTPPDATAPTTSTLSASGITTSSTDLTWTAATDNVNVTGYNVYQNGVLKTTTTTTSLAVSGLTASTAYNFYVKAKDAAGNLSAASNTVNITTLTPPDITAPTVSNLSASGITTSSTSLTWTVATDNIGVTGYNVYENGVLKTTTTTTSLAVTGLTASTGYNFYLKAKDAAGNLSAASNTVNITTLTPPDITAPTTSTLSASGITTSSTDLTWTAATDNVGVTGYNVYENGVLKTTTTTTSFAVSGLAASTAYNFYVKAIDAAGNLSVSSNIVNVTTLASSDNKPLYCSSSGTSTAIEYINKVQIGTINYISGINNGYGDFTSMSTDLFIGNSNNIIITPSWNGLAVREAYCVWIDYNHDGDFDDIDEQIFIKSKTKAISVSGSFIIPTTALLGSTRIRVSMKYSAFPNSCGVFSRGEVEDYIVNIKTVSTAKPEGDIVVTNTDIKVEDTNLSIKLYPNPVKGDLLNITNLQKPADFRIFNLMGQVLDRNHIENDIVNVGSLKIGVYFIEVSDGTSTIIKRFIKE